MVRRLREARQDSLWWDQPWYFYVWVVPIVAGMFVTFGLINLGWWVGVILISVGVLFAGFGWPIAYRRDKRRNGQ
jgi:hypothetical protein